MKKNLFFKKFINAFLNKLTVVIFIAIVLAVAGAPVFAGEGHDHGDKHSEGREKMEADTTVKKTDMNSHMEAMMRLKERVSKAYKIMDRTPVVPTEESLAKGKALYSENCAICHGDSGDGKGPAAAGMSPPPANFMDIPHSNIYRPGEKFWIITNGSMETGMPGFSADISSAGRWHLVNYILSLQEGVKPGSHSEDHSEKHSEKHSGKHSGTHSESHSGSH